MDWKTEIRAANADQRALHDALGDSATAFSQFAAAATKPGALDTRTKELIAVAIGVSKQCNESIGFHVRAAIRHGATREEIVETLSMCVYLGGGPALMYAGKALAAFDQLTDN
ncbi:MAG: carboxymuconolactone decarboxylase family protein [Paracoccaceae bacterium]